MNLFVALQFTKSGGQSGRVEIVTVNFKLVTLFAHNISHSHLILISNRGWSSLSVSDPKVSHFPHATLKRA